METRRTKLLILAAFAAIYLIWGSTYLGIRIAVETMPPFFLSAVRFLVAGTFLYALARALGHKVTRAEWRTALIVGICLTTMGNGLVVFAEQRVPSAFAALLIPLVSMWLTLFNWWFGDKKRPSPFAFAGIVFGLAAVAVLSAHSLMSADVAAEPMDIASLFIATLAWAYGTIYSRSAPIPKSPILFTGMQMLCGTMILVALSAACGELSMLEVSRWSWASMAALGYLIVFGSIVAFSAYTFLMTRVSPSVLGTYAFVNPLIAMAVGAYWYGEPIGVETLAAAGLILSGVALVLWGNSRASRRARLLSREPESPPICARIALTK